VTDALSDWARAHEAKRKAQSLAWLGFTVLFLAAGVAAGRAPVLVLAAPLMLGAYAGVPWLGVWRWRRQSARATSPYIPARISLRTFTALTGASAERRATDSVMGRLWVENGEWFWGRPLRDAHLPDRVKIPAEATESFEYERGWGPLLPECGYLVFRGRLAAPCDFFVWDFRRLDPRHV
jgi:hypothetical protein